MVEDFDRISRRRFLQTGAVTGSIGLLAGCLGGGGSDNSATTTKTSNGVTSGNGDNSTTTTKTSNSATSSGSSDSATTTKGSSQNSGKAIDKWFVLPHWKNMSKIQFNLWNPTRNMNFGRWFIWDPMTHFHPVNLKYEPMIATDWSRDKSALTMNIREGLSWHSGQSFGAQDIVNHYKLGSLVGYAIWDFIDEVTVADKHTVKFELSSSNVNTAIMLNNILDVGQISTHPELHKQFLDRLKDTTTDNGKKQLKKDLVSYKIPPKDAIKTVGNGPVEITDVNSQVMTLEPYDDYPIGFDDSDSTEINFKGVKSRNFGTKVDVEFQAAAADRVDGYRSTPPPNMREQFADHWDHLAFPTFGGQAIFFSPKSIFGKNTERSRKLRQAIAYWYNPKKWVKIYGEDLTAPPEVNNVTGLANPQDKEWIQGNVELTNYGDKKSGWRQAKKASQRMKDANFEKNGDGMWVDTETDKVLSAPVQFPSAWSDGVPAYQNVAEQLNNFGIKSQPSGQSLDAFLGGQLSNDKFKIAMVSYGSGPHPYAAFRQCLGSLATNKFHYRNKLETLSVPWPVGSPNGDSKDIKVNDRIKQLAATTDEKKEQSLVEELAWTVNQWVPFVEVETRSREIGFATDDWKYGVAKDSPQFQSDQPWSYLLRTGNLSAKN